MIRASLDIWLFRHNLTFQRSCFTRVILSLLTENIMNYHESISKSSTHHQCSPGAEPLHFRAAVGA